MNINSKLIAIILFGFTCFFCIYEINNKISKNNEKVMINSGVLNINKIKIYYKNKYLELTKEGDSWKSTKLDNLRFKIEFINKLCKALKNKQLISTHQNDLNRYKLDNDSKLSFQFIKNSKLYLILDIGKLAPDKKSLYIQLNQKNIYLIDKISSTDEYEQVWDIFFK